MSGRSVVEAVGRHVCTRALCQISRRIWQSTRFFAPSFHARAVTTTRPCRRVFLFLLLLFVRPAPPIPFPPSPPFPPFPFPFCAGAAQAAAGVSLAHCARAALHNPEFSLCSPYSGVGCFIGFRLRSSGPSGFLSDRRIPRLDPMTSLLPLSAAGVT